MTRRKPKLQNWGRFKIPRVKLAKLELRRGDTLVLKTEMMLTRNQCTELLARVKPYVPTGCKMMLLTSGLKIEVLARGSEP